MRLLPIRSAVGIAILTIAALAITASRPVADESVGKRAPDVAEAAANDIPVVVVSDSQVRRSEARRAEDVLWLARCIYSETKQPHEQRLVAWVVRNRVETRYRGRATYRTVVLDPFQFSAFNPDSGKREEMLALVPDSAAPGWGRALEIAAEVYAANSEERPFAKNTRHFYSEQSMVGRAAPAWAHGRRDVAPEGVRVDPRRFRFFAGVSVVLAM